MSLLDATDRADILTAFGADDHTITVAGSSLAAVFRRPYANAGEFAEIVEIAAPYLLCSTADLPTGAMYGAAVTVDSDSYTIIAIDRLESGLCRLQLTEA